MTETQEDNFSIIYSNYLEFNGRVLAFRKKLLFDITHSPQLIKKTLINGSPGYLINRKFLSLSKAQTLIINTPIKVDLTGINWHRIVELKECFNLD